MTKFNPVQIHVTINASSERVWKTITDPDSMKAWMGEPELQLQIKTNWQAGQPIVIRGFHHVSFENRGIVLAFEPSHLLRYSHLSSVSRLADKPENYSIIEFRLEPLERATRLTISLSNFPTKAIFKHLEFYWRNTVGLIKGVAEAS